MFNWFRRKRHSISIGSNNIIKGDVTMTIDTDTRNNGWTPASKPPKKDDFYLVYTDKGRTTECRYCCDEWITTYCNNEKVTHWRLLPKPPKEKNK